MEFYTLELVYVLNFSLKKKKKQKKVNISIEFFVFKLF